MTAGRFETVALSSDDSEILAEVDGLEVLALPWPAELATADARSFDVLRGSRTSTAVVPPRRWPSSRPPRPFTAPEDVVGTLALLESSGPGRRFDSRGRSTCSSSSASRAIVWSPTSMPSQQLPELSRRNGSVYATRLEEIDAAGRFLSFS